MILKHDEIIELYRRRAKRYDFTANLYYLLGFREWRYREKAVAELSLRPGDTVVEIGCGRDRNDEDPCGVGGLDPRDRVLKGHYLGG